MKRILTILGIALILAVGASVPVAAQSLTFSVPVNGVTPVSKFVTADDTDVLIRIRYIGSDAGGGEVAAETDGNLTFTVATVASTDLECPVSGALGGIIDVSDAACNTWGEVVDIINGGSLFRAELIGAKRSDSSVDALLAQTIVTVDSYEGRSFLADTTTALKTGVLLAPANLQDLGGYFQPNGTNRAWPFDGQQVVIRNIEETATFVSGACTFEVWATDKNDVETLLFTDACAATTAEGTFTEDIIGPPNQKITAQIVNTAAHSAVRLEVLADVLYLNR